MCIGLETYIKVVENNHQNIQQYCKTTMTYYCLVVYYVHCACRLVCYLAQMMLKELVNNTS